MKEEYFLLFYKINKRLKSISEAKRRVGFFWETLVEILIEEDEIAFKNWGKFKLKRCKSRKYSSPYSQEIGYTKSKCVIKFKVGNSLRKSLNEQSEYLEEK